MERVGLCIAVTLSLAACERQPESVAPLYEAAPVETRPIAVTVDAAGVIEPQITVEVKSKASGEILALHAETGDVVEEGFLLVEIDQRIPRNQLAEAEASLVAARARRTIAETQMERSKTLFGSGTLTEFDYEQSQLEYANAQAEVIRAEVALENSRIAMDDTQVRAPITGTVIEKGVETGTVISSPTRDVSGGSILLRMADLTIVQVRTLVDETDIGKIKPGMVTRVTVAAYPNQPFDGEVLKIEPQAIVEQNVTMFAVLIRLENRAGLLKPGMNAEVEIQIATREAALVVPTMALRVDSDIPAAALMLGLDEAELRSLVGGAARADASPARVDDAPAAMDARAGPWPGGGRERPGDGEFTGAGGLGGMGSDGRGGSNATDYQFGGEYWVVTLKGGQPVPVSIRTGLTDLQYSEVVAGLTPGDRVLMLPSSSLFEQQALLQQFITDRFSSTPFQQAGNSRGVGRFR